MSKEGPTNPRVTIAVTRQLNLLRNKAPDGNNNRNKKQKIRRFIILIAILLLLGVVLLQLNEADIFDIQADLIGPSKNTTILII